jgi:hypothetical protein
MGYFSLVLCVIDRDVVPATSYIPQIAREHLIARTMKQLHEKFYASQEKVANIVPSLQPYTNNDIASAPASQPLRMTYRQHPRALNIAHRLLFTRWHPPRRIQPDADKCCPR